ncbi:sensor domain-containing diguanylate cyclase [Thermanaerovibrio acidaminovorans]|uniref:sensor domain-containing diguanylate cyclase n=1 Tax=Thermanaerovibrio acidaminovorans TaxID=81462 RepID=UPI0024930D99|nr:sensor domain-containing diguanylate cyclase [Thermanaerovibrio acidaminovorans]
MDLSLVTQLKRQLELAQSMAAACAKGAQLLSRHLRGWTVGMYLPRNGVPGSFIWVDVSGVRGLVDHPLVRRAFESSGAVCGEWCGGTGWALPLSWAGEVLGVLLVAGEAGCELGFEEAQLVEVAASLLAAALVSLRLKEQIQREASLARLREGALNLRVAMGESLARLFIRLAEEPTVEGLFRLVVDGLLEMGYQVASVVSRSSREGPMEFRCNRGSPVSAAEVNYLIEAGLGLVGRVMSTGQAYLCEDCLTDQVVVRTEGDIRSELGVPMWGLDGHMWGMIRVGKRQPRSLNLERDGKLLEALGAFLALRIERNEMICSLRRELDRTRLLHRVVQDLQGAVDLEDLAQRVVASLSAQAGYDLVEFYQVQDGDPELLIVGSSVITREEMLPCSIRLKEAGGGLVSKILQTQRLTVHRCSSEDGYLSFSDRSPAQQLDVPIFVMGRMRGVISVESHREAFDSADIWFFETLAWHVGALWEGMEHLHLLELQSFKDPLTGLWNRKYLEARLEEELRRSARSGQAVCIAMVDLSNFKAVNDTYGHEVGDRVLAEVARALSASVRSCDVLVRYGGDEFVVFSPGAGERELEGLLSRVRASMEEMKLCSVGGISFDYGVTCFSPDENIMDAIARADGIMYLRKRGGR